MQSVLDYQDRFLKHVETLSFHKSPKQLYEPIEYILSLGGKRMRPILTLMATDVFNGDIDRALPAATAVEVFHNFSLIHDDIMDAAPLRRGKATVHEKWDLNTGILSGDAMLILAYQFFEAYEPEVFQPLAKLFSKTALEVCEGQQWDMEFETREDVSIPEYLKMIEYKTAVLVGAAMKMGAIVAGTSTSNADKIYDFGLHLGLAFQLQDDYLDAFGEPEKFGKQVGGDIIENKKTYLFLKALEKGAPEEQRQLLHMFSIQPHDNTDKINSVKELFVQTGADLATQFTIQHHTLLAFELLDSMDIEPVKKQLLKDFGTYLMSRNT